MKRREYENVNRCRRDGESRRRLTPAGGRVRLPVAAATTAVTAALLTVPPAQLAALTAGLAGGGAGGTELIAVGDDWRYFPGLTAPSDPPEAWRGLTFDDAGWASGPSGFGYDDGDDETVLEGMEDNYRAVFIRHTFELAEVPAEGVLELEVDYDDGFIAFLNGAEVARGNMDPGDADEGTEAAGSHEAGDPEFFDLGTPAGRLVAGTNVLAIQGHNTSLGSSDFSLIPALRIRPETAGGGPVRDGEAWVVGQTPVQLSGRTEVAGVTAVRFAGGGGAVSFDPAADTWEGAADLVPGANLIAVEAAGDDGAVLESATLEVVYLPPENVFTAGALAGSQTWSGAVRLEGEVILPAGAAVDVTAGTRVYLGGGASLEVEGRFSAVGTAEAPVRFTRYGEGAPWRRILFKRSEPGLFQHCIIEYADCEGDHKDYYDTDCDPATPFPPRDYFQAITAVASHLDIDSCLFQNLPDESGGAEGDAIAIISDDPEIPGEASAHIRGSRFIGIGQGIHTRFAYVLIEDNFFTAHNGDNDDIDLYGESDPPPMVRRNLMINPDADDMINPTRCSAILVGNVIAGSGDHGIVLRDLCAPVLINNLIYDCSAAAIAVQNQCDALLINNTIVNCGRGLRLFDHTGRWGPPYCLVPGSGRVTVVNTIIWDCPTPFDLADSPWEEDRGSHATVINCIVEGGEGSADVSGQSTFTWGAGNHSDDPSFSDEPGEDFRLRSAAGRWDPSLPDWVTDVTTSPAIDAGADPAALAETLGLDADLLALIRADYDGGGRPLDGDGDGVAGYDIGAFEGVAPAADSSRDGVPDGWYHRFGLNPADPANAAANPDNDFATTFEEWLADTDPTDPNAFFRVDAFTLGGAGGGARAASIRLSGAPGRAYTLFASPDLATWTPVAGQEDIPGDGGEITLTDTDPAARVFYRVAVRVVQ